MCVQVWEELLVDSLKTIYHTGLDNICRIEAPRKVKKERIC